MRKKIKVSETRPLTAEDEKIIKLKHQVSVRDHIIRDERKTVKYWIKQTERLSSELDVALAVKEHAKPIKITPRLRDGKSETTGVLVLSDWHVEESVDPDTVNGRNEYNLTIAERRIKQVFRKTLLLTDIWRNRTRVDTLVVALLGDFISGYIHEELAEDNNLSPTQAVLWVQKRILGGLKLLLDEGGFKEIKVVCCVGNHGRTTRKPRIATAYKNSFEWLMYHSMADMFEQMGEKRVTFSIENGYHNYFELYGRTIRFHHGDSFNYREGIGGISVPVNKGILRWNKTRDAWMDIFGHWHQSIDAGSWLCNSSLIGYNAFALKIKAPYEPPSQTLMFVEKTLGKTATLPLWVQ